MVGLQEDCIHIRAYLVVYDFHQKELHSNRTILRRDNIIYVTSLLCYKSPSLYNKNHCLSGAIVKHTEIFFRSIEIFLG